MKKQASRVPEASFATPPHPPAPVAAALASFDELGNRYGALQGDISDAKLELAVAKQTDLRTTADAYAAGAEVKDPGAGERAATAKLDRLQAEMNPLALALDEAGNALAVSVATHRAEWLESLAVVADEAASRYTAALDAAVAALRDLGPAKGAVGWLEDFDAAGARIGRQQGFHVTRLYCNTTAVRSESDADPLQLLAVLATIASDRASLYRQAASVNAGATGHRGYPVAAS